ncbi:MAG TPA: FMN-binding negative transcriptional regulator [Ureibacillus sp.]|nr:FMN-binding negative transcriptional regulator [Ureibacillus sp.]
MYIPKQFKIEDEKRIHRFIEEYSFATLISHHNGEPYATHLPLVLHKSENALYGHFARANGQWKDIENQQVLSIFHGPHAYISSSWYETKDAVPTWNYVAVHVYGKMEIIDDPNVISESLSELVLKYEGPASSYNLNDVDSNYVEGLRKGIVPFKIHISRIEAKAKLSQNHSVERRQLVIDQLEKSSHENQLQIAELMIKEME